MINDQVNARHDKASSDGKADGSHIARQIYEPGNHDWNWKANSHGHETGSPHLPSFSIDHGSHAAGQSAADRMDSSGKPSLRSVDQELNGTATNFTQDLQHLNKDLASYSGPDRANLMALAQEMSGTARSLTQDVQDMNKDLGIANGGPKAEMKDQHSGGSDNTTKPAGKDGSDTDTKPTATADTKAIVPATADTKAVAPDTADTKAVVPATADTKAVVPATTDTKAVVPATADTKAVVPATADTKAVVPATADTKAVVPATSDTKAVVPATADTKAVVPATTDTKAVVPATADTKAVVPATTDIKSVVPATTDTKAVVPATSAHSTTPTEWDPSNADGWRITNNGRTATSPNNNTEGAINVAYANKEIPADAKSYYEVTVSGAQIETAFSVGIGEHGSDVSNKNEHAEGETINNGSNIYYSYNGVVSNTGNWVRDPNDDADWTKVHGTTDGPAAPNTWANNSVIGVAVDRIDNTVGFTLNGQNEGTYSIKDLKDETLFPDVSSWYKAGPVATINGGSTPFAEAVPAGYTALDAAGNK
jgi:hypothetical protein